VERDPDPVVPVAFGAAISEDRKHASVVAALRSDRGKVLIDLPPEFYTTPLLVTGLLVRLQEKHDPLAIVVNPKSQSGTLVQPLLEAGIVALLPTAEEVAAAHGEFLDLVAEGGLERKEQPPLTAAVRASQQRSLAGAKAWDPRVGVDQSPLVAATLAVWALRNWERVSDPGAFVV